MKLLLLTLLIGTAQASLQSPVKVVRPVTKLTKIVYLKQSRPVSAKFDESCLRLRSKSPAFLCTAITGYQRMCFLSSSHGITKVDCKRYDEELQKVRMFGPIDKFSRGK